MLKKCFIQCFLFIFPLFAIAQRIEPLEPEGVEAPANSDSSEPKEDRVARFKSNGLYGFKNLKTEKVFVQPEYESMDEVFSDFMVAKKNGKTGVVNKKGEVVIPFEFQRIRSSSPDLKRRFPFILAAKNGFWGLIDANGRTIEAFTWTEADFYHQNDSLVLLSKKGMQRLLDRQGNLIIATNFDRWESSGWISSEHYIYARLNGKAGLIDLKKKVMLPFEFEQVVWVEDKVVCIINNKRYGLVSLITGQSILPAEHGYIRSKQAHGLYVVNTLDAQKQGLVDSKGAFVLPIEYTEIDLIAANSLIAAKNKDSKIAIFDLRGKQLTDFLFQKTVSRDDVPGLFFGAVGEQKYRLLNGDGKFVSPEIFESAQTSPTAFSASVGSKTALFRLDGGQATAFKYYGAAGFDSLINRQRAIEQYRLAKDKTWIGRASVNGRDIFIDSEGGEFDPSKY